VGAEESKKRLMTYNKLSYITNIGPKGGSACAATVINGLITIFKDILRKIGCKLTLIRLFFAIK